MLSAAWAAVSLFDFERKRRPRVGPFSAESGENIGRGFAPKAPAR